MALTALDYEHCRNLQAKATFAIDWGHAEEYASLYTEDGKFEVVGLTDDSPHRGGFQGSERLKLFINTLNSQTQGHCRHVIVSNYFEEVSDTEMKSKSYLMCLRVGVVPVSAVTLTGIYWDTYSKVGGKWLIKDRVVRLDPQPEHENSTPPDVLLSRQDRIAASITKAFLSE